MARRRSSITRQRTDAPPELDPLHILRRGMTKAKPYMVQAGIAIAVVVIILVVVVSRRSSRNSETAEAFALLEEGVNLVTPFTLINEKQAKTKIQEKRTKMEEILDKYPATPAAIDARFHLAKIEYSLKNYDAAAAKFAEFYGEYTDQQPLTALAYLGEANSIMSKEDHAGAIAKFQNIYSNADIHGGNFNIAREAKNQAAICHLLSDNRAGAKALLTELASDAAASAADRKRTQQIIDKLKILPPLSTAFVEPEPEKDDATPDTPDGDGAGAQAPSLTGSVIQPADQGGSPTTAPSAAADPAPLPAAVNPSLAPTPTNPAGSGRQGENTPGGDSSAKSKDPDAPGAKAPAQAEGSSAKP